MPMIDVYAPAGIFPADADEQLGTELTRAVLRAEGVAQPGPFHLDNTAAFIHRLPAESISTASTPGSPSVRVQIVDASWFAEPRRPAADHCRGNADSRQDRRRS